MSSSPETRTSPQNCWAIIPAAGVGKRMGSSIPKQYLPLAGETVIEHALKRLDAHPRISGLVVAVSENDEGWPELELSLCKPLYTAAGGAERCHSVLNALFELSQHADDEDWVLVHDAARPCLRDSDITLLIDILHMDEVGGLLASPVRDTMKRASADKRVIDTVDREGLWHALTPQMFRLGMLRAALDQALEDEVLVTDEASAMELAGYKPKLVEGHSDNIKITRPGDLPLAAFYLQQQEKA